MKNFKRKEINSPYNDYFLSFNKKNSLIYNKKNTFLKAIKSFRRFILYFCLPQN